MRYADISLAVQYGGQLFTLERRLGNGSTITIGRAVSDDIYSRERIVSNHHGTILYDDGVKYFDHSTNGSYRIRNGQEAQVHKMRIPLAERDALRIGELLRVTVMSITPVPDSPPS